MDLEFNEDQTMLSDTVRRFVTDNYDFVARQKIIESGAGWSRDIWAKMAELGLLGIAFSGPDGGFGGGGVEQLIVMQEIGSGLMLEPYFASIILAGGVIRIGASAECKAEILPGLIAGESICTLAHYEVGMPRHTLDAGCTAIPAEGGWQLDGQKIAVLHAGSADQFIVSARTDEGVSLFLVPAGAPGLSVDACQGYDSVPAGSLRLEKVRVGADAVIGAIGGGGAILDHAFDDANAALVAEAVGVMSEAFDLTVGYLKTRKQFGVAIGSYQALQHRAAEMLIELELSRSMAILAALSTNLDPIQRKRNISAAKTQICKSGRRIAQEAVQMHGAIGVTTEYKVGHALKRLTAIEAMLGDRDCHLGRIIELGGIYADLAPAA